MDSTELEVVKFDESILNFSAITSDGSRSVHVDGLRRLDEE
jgi:hypothetical protein